MWKQRVGLMFNFWGAVKLSICYAGIVILMKL